MLSPKRLYVYNLLMLFIPVTSFFALKRILLRWCGATIGTNVRICSTAQFLGTGILEIGEETFIGHHSLIVSSAKLKIGAFVGIGPQVYIGTGGHEIDPLGLSSVGKGFDKNIIIEDGCWIGLRATIMPGVTIGKKSVVGAGAVVTRALPGRIVALGVPARVTKTF